jgi:excisionase family DNA binding protein
MQLPLPFEHLEIPEGLPSWVDAFVREATLENETLAENGARQAVTARVALLQKLLGAANRHLDAEVDVPAAARLLGCHPETVRRAIRAGALPDRRTSPRGHHHIRRRDLDRLAASSHPAYDPIADAQDIAQRRRK